LRPGRGAVDAHRRGSVTYAFFENPGVVVCGYILVDNRELNWIDQGIWRRVKRETYPVTTHDVVYMVTELL
jgi:hypothetical protein